MTRSVAASRGIAWRLLGTATAVLLVVSACSSSAATPSPAASQPAASAPAAASPAASAAASAAIDTTTPMTLNVLLMQQAAYSAADITAMDAAFTKAYPNITINPELVSYDSLHDKIVTAQVGGSGKYDVVLMDTPWPAELVKANIVSDITSQIPANFTTGVFDSAWTAAKYNGKVYGVPWINDTKFFFYNTDMFTKAGITAAPKTWDEVEADAKAIKAAGVVKYPITASWKQAEAVICDWTQLAAAFGGSDFVDASGKALFNQGGGLAALTFMKKLIDEGLVDPASLSQTEDDVNSVMSAGQSAMALNWTYGLSVMNDPSKSSVAGKIKVAPSPGEGSVTTSGVNGGMSLAVTTTTKHPNEALAYALFMASEQSQEMDVANALPMWKASFDNPAVTKGNPDLFAAAKIQFAGLVARPVVPYYTKLSNALQDAIQQVLLGKKTPQTALDDVAAQLPTFQQ
ncbi:MAG TPA: extracellular solute-binding protein [Candidatus Limnocylindrales bacterium]|jgi:multiple sugar transport system substrate-binding protein